MVGARDAEQLDGFDFLGVPDVRPGAEIKEFAVAVEGDGFLFRDVFESTKLVFLLSDFGD